MSSQVIDLAFPVRGQAIPLDHGYPVFSALSAAVPALRQRSDWGVHPILGERTEAHLLSLTRRSRVKLRIPATDVSELLPLAGAGLQIGQGAVQLGFPQVLPLTNGARLRSRFVTIKGFHEDEGEFANAVRRQLASVAGLNMDPERIELAVGKRRIMRIKGKAVVGFAVELTGLEADASVALQIAGLGGRRHMGAGMLVPPGRRS